MKNLIYICDLALYNNKNISLSGWIYNKRSSGKIHFLQIRDGTGFTQGVIIKNEIDFKYFDFYKNIKQESSIYIEGIVKENNRIPFSKYEIIISFLNIIDNNFIFPISKKNHGSAFLMENRHLWIRSIKQYAILRIRANVIRLIRLYFDKKGFILIDSPIITTNSCEGTSTLFSMIWFNEKKVFLSQSGQLYQEAACMAFGKTYCLGPVFRAEKSKTRKHLNEFWMAEAEVAFANNKDNVKLAEDLICFIVENILKENEIELVNFLKRDISFLKNIKKPFPIMTYNKSVQYIKYIRKSIKNLETKKMLNLIWGMDLGAPHENELSKRFKKPIIILDFPFNVKAFYMKRNINNKNLALCMDIIAPEGYGEIIGGGQREENIENILLEIEKNNLSKENLKWFIDLRKYGSIPHSGFGLGIERIIMWICKLPHIRETIPFPRTMDRIYP